MYVDIIMCTKALIKNWTYHITPSLWSWHELISYIFFTNIWHITLSSEFVCRISFENVQICPILILPYTQHKHCHVPYKPNTVFEVGAWWYDAISFYIYIPGFGGWWSHRPQVLLSWSEADRENSLHQSWCGGFSCWFWCPSWSLLGYVSIVINNYLIYNLATSLRVCVRPSILYRR